MDLHQLARAGDTKKFAKAVKGRSMAELNARDQFGLTPLHWAAQVAGDRQGKIVAALIAQAHSVLSGSNSNIQTTSSPKSPNNNNSRKDRGSGRGNAAASQPERFELDPRDDEGQTPLHFAVDKARKGALKRLVLAGANLDIQDKFKHGALHRAAALGQAGVVRLLLRSGANPNIQNDNGWTALHVSCYYYRVEIAHLLLSCERTDVDIPNKDGWTALHCVAMQGYSDLAALIISHGADINLPSKDGCTPLHHACAEDRLSVVQILLNCGAHANLRNTAGKRAIDMTTSRIKNLLKGFITEEYTALYGDGKEGGEIGVEASFSILPPQNMAAGMQAKLFQIVLTPVSRRMRRLPPGGTAESSATEGAGDSLSDGGGHQSQSEYSASDSEGVAGGKQRRQGLGAIVERDETTPGLVLFKATYIPVAPGPYSMQVTYDGKDIISSPFSLQISHVQTSVEKTRVKGLSSTIMVDIEYSFTIYARDKRGKGRTNGEDPFVVEIKSERHMNQSDEAAHSVGRGGGDGVVRVSGKRTSDSRDGVSAWYKDNGNGTYGVFFRVHTPSMYFVLVSLHQQLVKRCPFPVQAKNEEKKKRKEKRDRLSVSTSSSSAQARAHSRKSLQLAGGTEHSQPGEYSDSPRRSVVPPSPRGAMSETGKPPVPRKPANASGGGSVRGASGGGGGAGGGGGLTRKPKKSKVLAVIDSANEMEMLKRENLQLQQNVLSEQRGNLLLQQQIVLLTKEKHNMEVEAERLKEAARQAQSSGESGSKIMRQNCIVCCVQPRDSLMIPCMHFLYCGKCVRHEGNVCRKCGVSKTGFLRVKLD
eukprot:TRINITY_DN6952_c0_g1_i1.p1 TRINITY_DN6952_c0_g1~~TRINITY_DN6952_c0_g1_i1.p1  ORF type:complete len:853 (+),score=147.08 TRINITY_DN6952_c0_g1_i1:106-2559(+)